MEPVFNKSAPPLTDEETKLAMKDLTRTYPRVVRDKCDPEIPRQNLANVSFKLLKEPKDGVYGLFCVRGVYDDIEKATDRAEFLIKTSDSTVPIHQHHVGYWGLITNNELYTSDQLDVKTSEQERSLRDRAQKEADLKSEQIKKELRSRKDELEKERTTEEFGTLDYYTTQRVSERELKGFIHQKEADLVTQKKSLKKVQGIITELKKKNPEHEGQWLENYNKARERAGLPRLTADDIEKIPQLGI